MYRLLLLVLCLPLFSLAQNSLPRFENDTLYTTSGFKVYKGQTLTFGKGQGRNGYFKFVRGIKGGSEKQVLTDNSVTVKKLRGYTISSLGNGYIYVRARIIYKDGSKGEVEFKMAFDKVMKSFSGLPPELLVPEEIKINNDMAE